MIYSPSAQHFVFHGPADSIAFFDTRIGGAVGGVLSDGCCARPDERTAFLRERCEELDAVPKQSSFQFETDACGKLTKTDPSDSDEFNRVVLTASGRSKVLCACSHPIQDKLLCDELSVSELEIIAFGVFCRKGGQLKAFLH